MESWLCEDRGNPTIKSMVMLSHFHCGMSRGLSNPPGLWCSALTLLHVSHRATCPAMSFFISFHQKTFLKSAYILVLPGCIQYLESCASDKISSRKASSLGTQILFLHQYVPLSSTQNSGHFPPSMRSWTSWISGQSCWALQIRSSRSYCIHNSLSKPLGMISSCRSPIS